MKFRTLRERCTAKAYRLNITRRNGKTESWEVHMLYTVEPNRKLGKWDAAEVESFGATITKWPVGYVNTLEVSLHE